MADQLLLIVQVASGSLVERQLRARTPRSVAGGRVAVEALGADPAGHLEPPAAGQVVLSVPSPETLARERVEVTRVIRQAGSGAEPLVVVVEAADELRDEELSAVLDAAGHTSRPVILRIIRDA